MNELVNVAAALAAHNDGCDCALCEAYAAGYREGQAEERRGIAERVEAMLPDAEEGELSASSLAALAESLRGSS